MENKLGGVILKSIKNTLIYLVLCVLKHNDYDSILPGQTTS